MTVSAAYPNSIIGFTTKTNKVDLVDADHINQLQVEVVALETELGKDVKAAATDLKTRLAVCLAGNGAIVNSPSFPSSPVANQVFIRNDADQMYQRNNANTQWLQVSQQFKLLSTTTVTGVNTTGDITLSTARKYLILARFKKSGSGGGTGVTVGVRVNADTGANYTYAGKGITVAGADINIGTAAGTYWDFGCDFDTSADGWCYFTMTICPHKSDTTILMFTGQSFNYQGTTSGGYENVNASGFYDGAAAVASSIRFQDQAGGSGLFDGTVEVFELAT